MQTFILIAGFLGAWLLVAGPVYQAAIELQEERIDQEGFAAATAEIEHQPKVSNWWWLLPPVGWLKNRRRNRAHRDAMMAALPSETREQTVAFLNKANGWLIVAGGAFLLAVKETGELAEQFQLPVAVFWVVIVVLPIACIANAVIRSIQSEKLLGHAKPEARRRQGTVR